MIPCACHRCADCGPLRKQLVAAFGWRRGEQCDRGRGKDALASGLRWLVLKSEVGQLYPTLCDLVQRARQATGLAQRAENEIQLLQRIHGMAMRP